MASYLELVTPGIILFLLASDPIIRIGISRAEITVGGVGERKCSSRAWSTVYESETELGSSEFVEFAFVDWPGVNVGNPNPVRLEDQSRVLLGKYELNPNSLTFGDKLDSLKIVDTTLVNGSLFDLLKSAVNLRYLKINGMGDVVDIRTPDSPTFLDKLETLTLSRAEFVNGTLYSLLKSANRLEALHIEEMRGVIDLRTPESSHFLGKLQFLTIQDTKLVNGVLYNFLKSANNIYRLQLLNVGQVDISTPPYFQGFIDKLEFLTIHETKLLNGNLNIFLEGSINLKYLDVERVVETDISKLPPKYLTQLSIQDSNLTESTPVKFEKLEKISLKDCVTTDRNIFENFDQRFPNVEEFSSGNKLIVNPKALASMLKSAALVSLEFSFDFDPPIKSFDFGVVMKIMMDAGYSHGSQWLESDAPPPDRDVNQRVHQILFMKKRLNGTYEWECIIDYTSFGIFGLVEDIKPQEPKAAIYIYFGLLSILIAVGLIGNTLSAIVLKRKVKSSATIILIGLTCFDFFVIFTYLLSSFFNAKLFYSMFIKTGKKSETYSVEEHMWMAEQNDVQTFIIYPLNKTAYTGSVYTTVLISLERFIAVCWPLKSKHLLRSRNSKLGMLSIFIFSVLLNFPRWIESYEWNFYTESSLQWNDYYRPTFMRIQSYKTIYHGWVWTIVMYILPFILMGVLNFRLLRQIKKTKDIRKSLQSANSETAGAKTAEEAEILSLTKMLLCVVAVFVVCNTVHIAIVFYFLMNYEYIELSTIEAVSCLPIIINSSVNFIIYIVIGKTLRAEFLTIIPKSVLRCFNSGVEGRAPVELSMNVNK